MPNPITDEEEQLIIRLWKDRKTGSEIGAALGRSRNSIMGKLNRLRAKGVIELLPEGEARFKPKATPGPKPPPVNVKKVPSMPKMPQLVTDAGQDDQAPFKPVFVPQPPKEEVVNPIKFTSLKPMSCRYIVSGKRAEEYMFCGKRKEVRSYCKDHAAMVYVKVEKKRPNPVDTFKLERMSGFLNK